jgi:predicted nucleic-acid-binding protein
MLISAVSESPNTNIVVRYLIKDDTLQAKLAIELFKNNRCFILKTVILETVWVLSSKQGYALARDVIVNRIQHLLKLPAVIIEELNNVILALHWYALRMDFTDALYLAASLQIEQFVTFDKCMVNKANAININQVISWLEMKDN